MAVLIYSENASGMVGMPAGNVAGSPVYERRYIVLDHFVEVDGPVGEIVQHDVEQLCALPGFRLATAREQSAYTKAQRDTGAVSEIAGG